MTSMEVVTPGTVQELAAALNRMTPESRILAGGTDLIIALRRGEVASDMLVDISGVDELRRIRREGNRIVVGANATFSEILQSDLIKKNAACLAQAAGMIGSVQIRNRATIGGNIGTASPAGDAIPPLYVLKARASVLDGSGNMRSESIEDLFAGPYQTTLKHNEAIVDFCFSVPGHPAASTFVKLGTRSTVTIARLNLAVAVSFKGESTEVDTARVALGAVGRTVFRSTSAEKLLTHSDLGGSSANEFAELLRHAVEESIAGRYSLPYKRRAIAGLAYQALDSLPGVRSTGLGQQH